MPLDLAYNVALLAGDALALAAARRGARLGRHSLAPLALAPAALALALALHGGTFERLRLLSYAVFLHGPLVAASLALLFRRKSRPAAWAYGALAAIVAAAGVDAFFVEPRALEVSRVRVESRKVTKPITVVLVADLQAESFGEHERRALRLAMAERPDLVLFAGDYAQVPRGERAALRGALRDFMQHEGFGAPLGVYAVRGNVESDDWPETFAGLPVVAMTSTRSVDAGEVRVTGLALEDSFDPTLSLPPSERFHIVFGHAPDFALGPSGGDLLLAGHTHGGQVRLPWFGPPITFSAVPRSWAAGVTELEGGRTLAVSRGVGLERGAAPRLRFLCRPELLVVRVEPPR